LPPCSPHRCIAALAGQTIPGQSACLSGASIRHPAMPSQARRSRRASPKNQMGTVLPELAPRPRACTARRARAGLEQPVGDVLPHRGMLGQEELLEDEPDLHCQTKRIICRFVQGWQKGLPIISVLVCWCGSAGCYSLSRAVSRPYPLSYADLLI
jgi:hypothetical protein